MSENMKERVRTAIRHAERFGRDRATAAIEAMREPTEMMREYGEQALREFDCDFDITSEEFTKQYNNIILHHWGKSNPLQRGPKPCGYLPLHSPDS